MMTPENATTLDEASLGELFSGLYVEARETAEHVFEQKAVKGAQNPCAYLVEDCYFHPQGQVAVPTGWPSSWRSHWHLPEPFIGNALGKPRLAFVGLNPSIDYREPCPTYSSSQRDWIRFWLDGFDEHGSLRVAENNVPLYEYYQRVLKGVLGADAVLGRDALVTELIRYKAACPNGRDRGAAALRSAVNHTTSLPLTLTLLKTIEVSVVVTVGGLSTQNLGGHFVAELRKAKITEVHGCAYKVSDQLCIVPALHNNHHGSKRPDDLAIGIRNGLAMLQPKPPTTEGSGS